MPVATEFSISSRATTAMSTFANGVIKDSAGNLYGTTSEGGYYSGGTGVVFKVAPDGPETVLYTFCSQNACSDGANPMASLIKDNAGNLYGTTWAGGSSCQCGVVFKLALDGVETVLHIFCSQNACSDGALPDSSLIKDRAGGLYGTTYWGGAYNEGVVFRLAPDGTETPLYAFTGGSDGANPNAGVIEDQSGNLYGTTAYGGAQAAGVVFKLAPDGTEKPCALQLCSRNGKKNICTDGWTSGGVIEDQAGNLYGTFDRAWRRWNL